jgi:undecaprenyl pyrophosphate phosphatase UppP
VPAILGAVLLKLKDVEGAELDLVQLGVGGATALVTGYLALVLLVKLVLAGRFANFCWYAWGAAIVAGAIAFV